MDEERKDTELQLNSKGGSTFTNTIIDQIAEKRLVRKLDWILLPLCTFACKTIPFIDGMSYRLVLQTV